MYWVIFINIFLFSLSHISAKVIEALFKEDFPCLSIIDQVQCNYPLFDPFTGTFGADGNEVRTEFFLFTPKNPDVAEPLHVCGGRLPLNTNYNGNFNTIIITGGYHNGVCQSYWMREMKDLLFIRGNYNIILVDWSWGSGYNKLFVVTRKILERYQKGEFKIFLEGRITSEDLELILESDDSIMGPALNTIIVGQQTAFVVKNILSQTGGGLSKFHLIGQSMGSHIAGTAGHLLKGLRRISALDPSLHPFEHFPDKFKLDHTDAQTVDVIHSNSGNSTDYATGNIAQTGHADFYPNGGVIQLSCVPYTLQSFLKLDFADAYSYFDAKLCSHTQAIEYYKQSINNTDCQFVGVACSSYDDFKSGKCNRTCTQDGNKCAVMGFDFDKFSYQDETRRKYFLDTRLLKPYFDNSGIDLAHYPVKPCNVNQTDQDVIREIYKRLFENAEQVLNHA